MNEEIRDKIFDFAYHEALNDATLQNAYLGKKDRIEEIEEAKNAVKEYINCIINKNPVWFYATEKDVESAICKALNTEVDDKEYFTFGNTQKLINMTVKYFFVACYFDDSIRGCFVNCHCPMDGKMIAVVRNKLQNSHKDCGAIRSDLSWSRLSNQSTQETVIENGIEYSVPKAYLDFQNAICQFSQEDKIIPIEFDFRNW